MLKWSVLLDHVIISCFATPPPNNTATFHVLFEAQREERETAEFFLIRFETAAVKVSGH